MQIITNRGASALALAAVLALAACKPAEKQAEAPTTDTAADALASATAVGAEWLTYGGTYDEQRHSGLTKVAPENVSQLGVAWTYDLNSNRGIETTPIVKDGVMYATSSWSVLHAIDAKTGKELWVYDPGADKAVGVDACCDVVNRGAALYKDLVIFGTLDAQLVALDKESGRPVWREKIADYKEGYSYTAAPLIVDGLVVTDASLTAPRSG